MPSPLCKRTPHSGCGAHVFRERGSTPLWREGLMKGLPCRRRPVRMPRVCGWAPFTSMESYVEACTWRELLRVGVSFLLQLSFPWSRSPVHPNKANRGAQCRTAGPGPADLVTELSEKLTHQEKRHLWGQNVALWWDLEKRTLGKNKETWIHVAFS